MINAALKSPDLASTVVVVNEFGEVGLDHSLVANSNDAVIVLENGCLCCTVRSDLVTTLNELYQSRLSGRIAAFDNVVIETSGLAEPGPVLQAFLSEPTLDGLYRVASVVTLVDAVNWPATSLNHEEAIRQVALADQIRITKLDLADTAAAEALTGELARLNPAAEIRPMDWSTAAIAALLTSPGFDAADPKADPRPGCRCRATRRARWSPAMSATTSAAMTTDTPLAITRFWRQGDRILRAAARPAGLAGRIAVPARRHRAESRTGPAQGQGSGQCCRGARTTGRHPGRPASAPHHDMARALARCRRADAGGLHHQGIARDSLKDVIELLDRMSERTFRAREKARARMEAG